MATYTSIPTFTSGQVLTSAVMNDVKNNLDLGNAQSAYPYRNLLYNGAMQISQRGTSTASITASGYYTADRWQTTLGSLGTWTQTVETDAPASTGLRRSLKMLCTSASASPAAGGVLLMEQLLEGFDVQRILKGTSAALSMTLSFYVKANVTGTYVVEIRDGDNTRHICRTYTISASGTWERKEILIPADTTGVFDNDSNASLSIQFWLGAGSTFTSGTLATSWAASSNANRAVGQTNLAAATNNYWQVTGVQLEVGSVSTPFEFQPYGDELRRCERYYETGTTWLRRQNNDTIRSSYESVPYRVRKRATPGTVSNTNSSTTNVAICTFVNGDDTGGYITWTSSSSIDFQAQVAWTASAEL